VSRTL